MSSPGTLPQQLVQRRRMRYIVFGGFFGMDADGERFCKTVDSDDIRHSSQLPGLFEPALLPF